MLLKGVIVPLSRISYDIMLLVLISNKPINKHNAFSAHFQQIYNGPKISTQALKLLFIRVFYFSRRYLRSTSSKRQFIIMQRPPQPLFLTRQLQGVKPPPGVKIPTLLELVKICSGSTFGPVSGAPYIEGVAYPPENPTVWIKHACSTASWNGVSAQIMAYEALREKSSLARVPGIYCAYELYSKWTYVVMEYVPDKTALDLRERTNNPFEKTHIHETVAYALSELCRIPILNDAIPADIQGLESVNELFHVWPESTMTTPCKNVGELEKRINKVIYSPNLRICRHG